MSLWLLNTKPPDTGPKLFHNIEVDEHVGKREEWWYFWLFFFWIAGVFPAALKNTMVGASLAAVLSSSSCLSSLGQQKKNPVLLSLRLASVRLCEDGEFKCEMRAHGSRLSAAGAEDPWNRGSISHVPIRESHFASVPHS